MKSYGDFAFFYDELTRNIDYKKRAEYFDSIIKKYGSQDKILLDVACGTGSLSEEFCSLGYDVIGADPSEDMLSVALDKKIESKNDIMYLCQSAQELDLYGTVDNAVCALDSLNHITDETELQKAVSRISLFLVPGGVFVFDVNTPYKHEHILSSNTFVYEYDNVLCVWQNSECKDGEIQITIDIFEKDENGQYDRFSEQFLEKAYPLDTIRQICANAGLEVLEIFDEDSFNAPCETSQRIVFVTKKK
ncbi:MAG: class I SAM-dependent methyltransferase [Oscillospiraceae bacterium]|nr:class I SAM-dependent methyltransferase [Oscillospiraceae bacterium]